MNLQRNISKLIQTNIIMQQDNDPKSHLELEGLRVAKSISGHQPNSAAFHLLTKSHDTIIN